MNVECFYVIKDQTIEGAREFAKEVDRVSEKYHQELYPVYICKAIKDIIATSDWSNWNADFKVKKGTWLVFVQGKDYCIDRVRPKGGRRGYPNRFGHSDFYDNFYSYIEDIEEVNSNFFERIKSPRTP